MSLSPQQLRDLAANAPIRETANAAMSVVNALSHYENPGTRLLAVAAVFLQMRAASDISACDLLLYAGKAVKEQGRLRPEFAAVRDYIEQEILA